ncbi:Ger(x)C family spore germination protein [Paenibacillus soyae]|uniref:Ger(X)C family spore germination protein n=1 Tax=Paenibacillus soyae TaxID=2969249 RepID=A0A9X2MTZ9_9BACL|nr:Ger(x)C family spore germination protein [Paenibacillus soyae]MCR2806981.1 Ger(x)C family spore germination protein [Paenibacillus soyae]
MNMTRYIKFFFPLLALALLTSCWNSRELNDMSIASALGFDQKGDSVQVSVQIINASQIAATRGGSGERLPIMTQRAGGRTLFEAVRALTTKTPRKVYASHIRLLVIGEQLARNGIADVLDFVSRDHEFRTDFYIVIAKDTTASDALKVLTPLEKLPSNKLFSSLESAEENWGVTATVDLHELIFDIVSKGKDPALASITIVGSVQTGQSKKNMENVTPAAFEKYNGLAVFRKDKLVGWLNTKESKGYSFVVGNMKNTVVRTGCPGGGSLAVELNRFKQKVKGSMNAGKPSIRVDLQLEGNIGDVECGIDLGKTASVAEVEEAMSDQVRGFVEAAVKKAKSYRADVFGFGNAIHRADARAWKELEDDWEEEFVHLPVEVNVEMKIRRTGSVIQSFLEDMED